MPPVPGVEGVLVLTKEEDSGVDLVVELAMLEVASPGEERLSDADMTASSSATPKSNLSRLSFDCSPFADAASAPQRCRCRRAGQPHGSRARNQQPT